MCMVFIFQLTHTAGRVRQCWQSTSAGKNTTSKLSNFSNSGAREQDLAHLRADRMANTMILVSHLKIHYISAIQNDFFL